MAAQEDLVAIYDKAPLDLRYWVSMALGVTASVFDFYDFFHCRVPGGSVEPAMASNFRPDLDNPAERRCRRHRGRLGLECAGRSVRSQDAVGCRNRSVRVWGGFGVADSQRRLDAVRFPALPCRLRRRRRGGGWRAVDRRVHANPSSHYHRQRHRDSGVPWYSLRVLSAATLLQAIGWRGLAMLGFVPLLPAFLIALITPELVRWLVTRGRQAEARAIVARTLGVPSASLPQSTVAANSIPPPARFVDLLSQPRLFWLTVVVWFSASTAVYGAFLWGPTIVALLLGIPPKDAAQLFVFVSLAGMLGRVVFSLLPHWLGRRRCGEIMGYGIALSLGAAALLFDRTFMGWSVFVVLLIPAALFFDGGFSNIAPYSAEIFPVRLSARGVGLAQAVNGIGKIVGPLCLALIAGTSNLISPKATIEAVMPAFLFLAACGLAIGLVLVLV